MVRPPATIRTALLAGFLVIVVVWMGSTFYFTGRLAESQARSAAIQSRLARGQELLFAIQNQVLFGSIYVRDALMEGLHIRASCRNCRHRTNLSLRLAKRLGYDHPLVALRRRLRCSKCGMRDVEVRTIEPERR